MIFSPIPLKGAFVLELEERGDERGFFARSFCQKEFQEHGLNPRIAQCSISWTGKRGTLRGMHYQVAPFEEVKIVRCTRGRVYDVIIDLRPTSETFKRYFAVELSGVNHKQIYVPEGFAHGMQVLEDDSEVFYQVSEFYSPECSRGVRWNDPAFGIEWPISNPIMIDRDRNYQDFIDEPVHAGADGVRQA